MRKIILTALIAVLAFPAQAQPQERTFKNSFAERTVWIEVADHWVEVWARQDGQCLMYPSTPTVSDGKIEFKAGTVWEINAVNRGIEITFPGGRVVRYRQTSEQPEAICGLDHQET